jgi:hypothetical protein
LRTASEGGPYTGKKGKRWRRRPSGIGIESAA